MIRVYKNTILNDYLRTCQGSRGYGLQICNGRSPLPIYGMYSNDVGITNFKLNRIDSGSVILEKISLSTDILAYVSGQYYIDNSKLFDVTIPEGVYFYEIQTATDIFYSEIFKIQTINGRFLSSGSLKSSSSKLVSDKYEVQ